MHSHLERERELRECAAMADAEAYTREVNAGLAAAEAMERALMEKEWEYHLRLNSKRTRLQALQEAATNDAMAAEEAYMRAYMAAWKEQELSQEATAREALEAEEAYMRAYMAAWKEQELSQEATAREALEA